MKPFWFVLAIVAAATSVSPSEALAQKETYDVLTYEPPAGWTKEVKDRTYTCYTTVNQQKKTYCRIFIMASTGSKGGIQQDFESEWKNLVADQYHVTGPAPAATPRTENGWQIRSATAPFTYSGTPATVLLTTMSGSGKAASIVAVTSSDEYLPAIRKFLASVELQKPASAAAPPAAAAAAPVASKFAFGNTRFDDGWTSTAREDWVEVAKGTTRVLIHYPNKKADAYNSVVLDGLKNAWNVLVAPRYGSVSNLAFRPIQSWESVEFAEADAVEPATGKAAHVVLFKKNYSNGNGRYLEFITPNRSAFEQEFGAYHESSSGWEKMEGMATYNKFAVAAADLQGKWTSDFSGAIQYVNAATGFDAGMDTHASVENFRIGPGSSYQWDLSVASGPVGNIKFQSVKSAGKFSVPGEWRVTFSDIEGKPRTYDAHFSCIKGLRILWLDNRAFAKAE